jgi:DNA processing protein
VARRLAADLAGFGLAVVSGLAHGIDAAAHRGALEAGGSTLAVLPGGLERIVPAGHAALAGEIAVRGALLSEHEPDRVAYRGSFLERNRLIAALARVVVVVEAAERSGALSTAGHARRLGRPVLAVPGDVDRLTSRGCHALLRSGARVCEGLADVLAALRGRPAGATAVPGAAPAAPAAAGPDDPGSARLLALLANHPATVEDCARAGGWELGETLERLLRWEWAGLLRAEPGGRWSRRESGR